MMKSDGVQSTLSGLVFFFSIIHSDKNVIPLSRKLLLNSIVCGTLQPNLKHNQSEACKYRSVNLYMKNSLVLPNMSP